MKNTVDDRLSNRYDAVEEDDNARPVILDLVGICSHFLVPRLTLKLQSDLHEEQHSNVENLQEVVEVAEVAEAEAKPRIRRLSLTTLIIVRFASLALIVSILSHVTPAGPCSAGGQKVGFESQVVRP